MINVVNKFIPMLSRNVWLSLPKACSICIQSFLSWTWTIKNIAHLVSWLLLQSRKLVEALEWCSADFKGTVLSSQGQRTNARESSTAIFFPPTQIICHYCVQMAFPLYRTETVYKQNIAAQRVTAWLYRLSGSVPLFWDKWSSKRKV